MFLRGVVPRKLPLISRAEVAGRTVESLVLRWRDWRLMMPRLPAPSFVTHNWSRGAAGLVGRNVFAGLQNDYLTLVRCPVDGKVNEYLNFILISCLLLAAAKGTRNKKKAGTLNILRLLILGTGTLNI
jgi:hypothetical protein